MKKFKLYVLAFALYFQSAGINAETINIRNDFSKPGWEMLGGNGEKGAAQAEFKDGALSLAGSSMEKVNIPSITATDFTAQVSFYLPDGAYQGWESAALALFGQPTSTRAYFMVITGQPGRQGDQRQVGLFPDQMKTINMPAGKWYTIKVSMAGGDGKMKIWEKGTKEPAKWDINVSLPGYIEKVSGVGVRTFGTTVQYDDFEFMARSYQPVSGGFKLLGNNC